MIRLFFFLFGFGLSIIGWMYIILYLNLTTIGYNFSEYVNFIIRRIECWNAVFGLTIILLCLLLPKEEKNELYLRYFS